MKLNNAHIHETNGDWEAVYSPCRKYRYVLSRKWGDGPAVAFCGLNPSTATAFQNDRTVARCIDFAKQWGFGGMYMLNLFAYRATDPKMMKAQDDPVGPRNFHYLIIYSHRADRTVCCWGANVEGELAVKGNGSRGFLAEINRYCFGLTKDGHPKHPLYLPKTAELIPFALEESQA